MKMKLMIAVTAVVISVSVSAQTPQTIAKEFVIAGIPTEPYRYEDKNGKITGIDVEIIEYIMNKLKIKYKIVLESSSLRLEHTWKNTSEYDMVMTYSFEKDRAEFLTYAKESHVNIQWNFFVRKEDAGKIKYEKYEDLKNIKIGAIEGFAYTNEFWDAHKKGLITLDMIPINETDRQLNKLVTKRIDAVPLNTVAALYQAKIEGLDTKIAILPKPLKKKEYYNTFVKKSVHPDTARIISEYDKIIIEMKKNGTLNTILEKYIGKIKY